MQESLPVLLTIEIIDYEKRGGDTFYQIEIMANATKTWTINRKFKDIEDMHRKLIKKNPNMPYLPAKNFFSLGNEDLDKRKDDLEKYLNVLASRKDMLSDPEFKNFLDLEKYVRPEHLTVVKELYEISNLPMGVKDFVYLPDKGVLFVLLAETRVVSKIGNFISSISKPQEVSSVIAYKEDPPGSLEFTQLWQHNLKLEGSMLSWDEGLTILAIGHTNGFIECIRVSTELGYSKYSPFCKIQYHTQSITGLLLYSDTGHLISGSLDKYITKTDIANDETNLAEKELSHPITCMIMDKSHRRFFVADSIGTIHIFTPEEKMRCLTTISFHQENFVKTLFYDKPRSLLIAGSNQGLVVVYEIGKPMREKFSSYSTSFEAVKQIRGLHFIGESKELYVANALGKVAFMNSLTTIPFHMLDAHDGEVTQMNYIEDLRLLVTSGLDKSVKFWRYPFDPQEKLPGKKLQPPKLPNYDYPELQQSKQSAITGAGEPDDEEEDEYEDTSPREKPVTLFQYRPAKDPSAEYYVSDEEVEEEFYNQNYIRKNESKNIGDDKKTVTKRPGLQPLASDEEDEEEENVRKEEKEELEDEEEEEKKRRAQASPKSNLFKNSVFEVIKKQDVKVLEKKQIKADPEKEAKLKAKLKKEQEELENNPLLRPTKVKKNLIQHKAEGKNEKKEEKAEKKKEENKGATKEGKSGEIKEKIIAKAAAKEKKKEEEKKEDEEAKKEEKEEKETEKPEEKTKKASNKEKKEEKPNEEKKEKKEEPEVKPQKEEKKQTEGPLTKKPVQEKKKTIEDPLAERPAIAPKKKKEIDNPLLGPGIKKPQKPIPTEKVIDIEKDIETANKNAQAVKKKPVRKSLLESDSDDDNLLDFQDLRYKTTAKSSKSTYAKKKEESEDEGELAGWAQ